jgi:hypothetical protein
VKWDKLAAVGIRPDSRCSMVLGHNALGFVLHVVCDQVGQQGARAEYRMVDGILTFSTAEDFERPLVLRRYPVGDLMTADPRALTSQTAWVYDREPLPVDDRWIEQLVERQVLSGFRTSGGKYASVRCSGGILEVTAPAWELSYVRDLIEQQERTVRVLPASPVMLNY